MPKRSHQKKLQARRAARKAERKEQRRINPPEDSWVVCEKCGFVQTHRLTKDKGCQRGAVLSGRGRNGRFIDLSCDGETAVTREHYNEMAVD